ncbi:MAG: hypothetical protein COA31_006890 [Flavobacteriales bacterium]|nr:hypothetical protein [Flavobacteriales bacterium]
MNNRLSIIHFNSIISITTTKNKVTNKEMEVIITFDDFDSYGKVFLMDNDLDTCLFPTVFEAKWQTMKHTDQEFLLISDIHKQNDKIGNYKVKVIPLKRV